MDVLAWGDSAAVGILPWADSALPGILAWEDSAPVDILPFPEGIKPWDFLTATVFFTKAPLISVSFPSISLTIVSLIIVSLMAIAMIISFTIETGFSLDLTSLRSDFRIGGTRGPHTMDILTTTTIPTTRRFMIIGIGAV